MEREVTVSEAHSVVERFDDAPGKLGIALLSVLSYACLSLVVALGHAWHARPSPEAVAAHLPSIVRTVMLWTVPLFLLISLLHVAYVVRKERYRLVSGVFLFFRSAQFGFIVPMFVIFQDSVAADGPATAFLKGCFMCLLLFASLWGQNNLKFLFVYRMLRTMEADAAMTRSNKESVPCASQ